MELKEARRRSDEVKCGQALPLVKGGTDGQGQLGKYRKYRGPLCLRLERHLEMLLQGAQLLRGLEALVERGAAPEAAAPGAASVSPALPAAAPSSARSAFFRSCASFFLRFRIFFFSASDSDAQSGQPHTMPFLRFVQRPSASRL